MAQASSAQREPSMEEILASIRRIIEDSDTGRKQGDEPAARQEPEPAASSEPAPAVDVEAFRAELHTTPEPVMPKAEAWTAPEVVPEKRPVTLADVQAQIAREAYPPAQEAYPSVPRAEAEAESEALYDTSGVPDRLGDDIDIEEELRAGESGDEEVEPELIETVETTQSATPPGETQWTAQAPKTAIISEHAGRQVAAAFGELSEAFSATRKKSFDELAEEMMRPMLQDWLDNNLPVLVERLVREEIERVARGGR